MSHNKGDFVILDYVARISETGEVFDTTIESLAREEGIFKEGVVYEPILVVIGEGWLLKAVEEELTDIVAGKPKTIEVQPEKAFGIRDPDKIKLFPLKKITSKGITPQVGMRVEIDGRIGTVRTIGSGRVLLDFNLPLAGKTLIYEITLQKKLVTPKEKIESLTHRRIPQIGVDKFGFNIKKDTITITVPEEAYYVEGLQLNKRGIFIDVQKFLENIRSVSFVETFVRPEPVEEKPSSVDSPEGS